MSSSLSCPRVQHRPNALRLETCTSEVVFSLSNKCSVEVERDSEALAHETMEVITPWTAAVLN